MLQRLSNKQKEFIREGNRRWNIKYGATRSGKTYLDYYVIPLRIRERMGLEGLNFILGNTQGTIKRNVIEPMQTIWGEEAISNIRADNSVLIFGEKAYCIGADNIKSADRIRGSSIKYCYGDEITTWSPSVFEMLKSRLDKPYSLFDGTTNPQGPNHWLKKFLDGDADIFQQHYSIDDNPFLDERVKEEMKKEHTGVYYDRFILGNWVLAEGLIFPNFADAFASLPKDEEGEYKAGDKLMVSCDYGTQNPFVAIVWKRVEGVWYAYKRYYYNGRGNGVQKTDEDYCNDLHEFLQPEIEACKESGRSLKFIVDPSASSFITLMNRQSWCKVIKADNAVADGLRNTATAIQMGVIKVFPEFKEWKEEAEGYIWEVDKAGNVYDDRPVKQNDHCMDATRYFVQTMNLVKPKTNYVPIIMR